MVGVAGAQEAVERAESSKDEPLYGPSGSERAQPGDRAIRLPGKLQTKFGGEFSE